MNTLITFELTNTFNLKYLSEYTSIFCLLDKFQCNISVIIISSI